MTTPRKGIFCIKMRGGEARWQHGQTVLARFLAKLEILHGRFFVGNEVIFMKELSYFLRYARETFALLPTKEERELIFLHADGCSRSLPLVDASELVSVASGDPRVGSIGVRSYFLRCDECKIKRTYRAR